MSNQDAGKVVGLKVPGSADEAQPEVKKAAAPAPGLTGLGSSGASAGTGLTGLGSSGASAGTGLTGLGTSGASAGTGLTGLGSSGASAGTGLTGLGSSGAPAGTTGLSGLGSSGASGLTGLGGTRPAPAAAPAPAAEKPAPRRSGIAIDVSAADRIKKLLADRGTPDAALRIRVRGGGCTGLQYDMEFADQPQERDRVFSDHDVKVFVDAKSYIFLIGTELRYQSGLLESGFKLENPNSKKACGCGESFTV